MVKRRVRLEGSQAIYPWRLGDNDASGGQDRMLAGILADAKKETGLFWNVRDDVRKVIEESLGNIKVTYHRHNGRVQDFSVFAPKELVLFLREKEASGKLFGRSGSAGCAICGASCEDGEYCDGCMEEKEEYAPPLTTGEIGSIGMF
jgi:hypothetical protein